MPERPIIDTPENWDYASDGYAEKIAPVMMETFAEEFIDHLDVHKDTRALEVAAGSGALTETYASRVGSLLVTDFSPKMLSYNQRRMQSGGYTNVSHALMDGQALDLEDNNFDRAASSFGVMLFPDRHKGFCELRRVVKAGR